MGNGYTVKETVEGEAKPQHWVTAVFCREAGQKGRAGRGYKLRRKGVELRKRVRGGTLLKKPEMGEFQA